MPCERNNLSRDNLLNSSDNLTANDENDSDSATNTTTTTTRKIDTNDVVILIDKSLHLSRDTITFETEKKHQQQQQQQQHSPSSKTPLLYAKKNVQSYQEQTQQLNQPPINEQFQQKSSVLLATTKTSHDFDGFYNIPSEDVGKLNEIDEFICKNGSSDNSSALINPFFNSTNEDFNTVKEAAKGEQFIYLKLINIINIPHL